MDTKSRKGYLFCATSGKNHVAIAYGHNLFSLPASGGKYLKAFLVYNDEEPPKTHDLIELAKFCGNFNADFSLLIPKCEYLIPFAVRTRYPNTSDPNDEDMKRALIFADDIIAFVKSKMPMQSILQEDENHG